MCDVLFLLDRTPEATLTAIPDVPALLSLLTDAAATVTLPDPTGVLLQVDLVTALFDVTSQSSGGSGPCPHMTALMDSSNQPIRESATGLVILVETHA